MGGERGRWGALAETVPRIAWDLNGRPDLSLFTDAATGAPLLAGVLFRPRPARALHLETGRVSSAWLSRFRRQNEIDGSELLAPISFAWARREILANSTYALYLDRNNAIWIAITLSQISFGATPVAASLLRWMPTSGSFPDI